MHPSRWLFVVGLAVLISVGVAPAADQDGDGVDDEIDSCPQDPNPFQFPRQISNDALHDWTRFAQMAWTHDESRVVYRSDRQSNTNYELFVSPWDGGTAPIDLSGLTSGREVRDFQISADDAWVVYNADREVAGEYHLYSVPLTGGASTRLDVAPIVRTAGDRYRLSADGTELFFVAEHPTVPGVDQVYRVPVSGGMPAMIDTWATIGLSGGRLTQTADGSRLLILGDDGGTLDRLGAVRLSDGAAVLLREAPTLAFEQTADGSHLIMKSSEQDDRLESVPSDGSAAPVMLNAPGEDVPVFDVTPQPVGGDYRVVWTVQGDGMFSNRLDGSDRRLVSSLDPRNPFDYPPDGAEVVFRHGGLFAAPVLGGGERVLSNLGAEGFAVAPDGSRVFFVDADFTVFPEQYRLWSVPFDGSPGELRHDQTLSSAAGVSSWFPAPTSDGVFYAATRAAGESLRIYWSPAALSGWTELSDLGRAQGNFLVAGDGRRIGYADSLPNVVIKPMHLYTRSLDPDRDHDGLAEACDCNDFDVSQLPPAEIVDSLRLSSQAGATRLAWTAPDGIGPGDGYTTMRAVTPDAYTGSGAIECLGGPSPVLEVIDPSVPPVGAAFSYVVRVDNGCGSGPLNDGRTAGETRVCP